MFGSRAHTSNNVVQGLVAAHLQARTAKHDPVDHQASILLIVLEEGGHVGGAVVQDEELINVDESHPGVPARTHAGADIALWQALAGHSGALWGKG